MQIKPSSAFAGGVFLFSVMMKSFQNMIAVYGGGRFAVLFLAAGCGSGARAVYPERFADEK